MVVSTPTSAPNAAAAIAALRVLLPHSVKLVEGAPQAWLNSATPEVLARDLALLVEPLGAGELRVRIASTATFDAVGREIWRLTVAVRDRPGLLASTAAVASQHRLSIVSARCASWSALDAHGEALALQQVEVVSGDLNLSGEPDWPWIGQDLRAALTDGQAPITRFLPSGPAEVTITPEGTPEGFDGCLWRVRVDAPDSFGLLAALCRWLTSAGANIEAAVVGLRSEATGNSSTASTTTLSTATISTATDELVVAAGPGFDSRAAELAAELSRPG